MSRTIYPDRRPAPTPKQNDRSAALTAGLSLVYIHGIKNKPDVEDLRCQWDMAIFEQQITASRMAYWVDRKRYPQPKPDGCDAPDITHELGADQGLQGPRLAFGLGVETDDPEEAEWVRELAAEMLEGSARSGPSFRGGGVLDPFAWALVEAFMPDAKNYFFNEGRRDEIRGVFTDALGAAPGPAIVVAHSLGTVIAYEAMLGLDQDAADVPLFLTLGSPLGFGAIERKLKDWHDRDDLPKPAFVDRWINVSHPADVICSDKEIADDYDIRIEDELLEGHADDAHAATLYLRSPPVRTAIGLLTGG